MKFVVYLIICWRCFVQFLFQKFTNFTENEYQISFNYWVGGKRYRTFISTNTVRIRPFSASSAGKDVTSIIEEYAGIGKNFGGREITPRMLGLSELNITTVTDDIHFKLDEIIILPRRL